MRLLTLIFLAVFSIPTMAQAVDAESGSITVSLGSEPPNLDSSLSQDTVSSLVLGLTNEGLVNVGRRGAIEPGVAERWEVGVNQVTFYLREEAQWSNGDPVTAHDFVYSFQRLVDPVTGASGSAFLVETIRNAEDIMLGNLPPESLGVEAIDDHTFRVELAHPAPYIVNLMANSSFFPLHREFVEAQGDRYAADADNILSNGAFLLEDWVHSASLTLKKNPRYWNADAIRLEEIDFGYITADVRSLFNLYKSDQLAALQLDEQVLKDAASGGHRIRKAPTNCIGYMYVNHSAERPLSNLKLRQAVRLAIDRARFVNNIVSLPGVKPIDSIFTEATQTGSGRFIREYPGPQIDYDITRARALLAEAKEEMGVDELPPLILLANERRQVYAEFIQSQLNGALGLDVRVDKQTFKQYIQKMFDGAFDLTNSGFCSGSFTDPISFAGMFTTDSPFNRSRFSSERYDELIRMTRQTADQSERMKAFDEAQRILFDAVAVIPTHQLSTVYVQHPALRGVTWYPGLNYATGFISE